MTSTPQPQLPALKSSATLPANDSSFDSSHFPWMVERSAFGRSHSLESIPMPFAVDHQNGQVGLAGILEQVSELSLDNPFDIQNMKTLQQQQQQQQQQTPARLPLRNSQNNCLSSSVTTIRRTASTTTTTTKAFNAPLIPESPDFNLTATASAAVPPANAHPAAAVLKPLFSPAHAGGTVRILSPSIHVRAAQLFADDDDCLDVTDHKPDLMSPKVLLGGATLLPPPMPLFPTTPQCRKHHRPLGGGGRVLKMRKVDPMALVFS